MAEIHRVNAGALLVLIAGLHWTPSAHAADARECASIANDQQRLACFDAAVRDTADAPSEAAAETAPPPKASPVKAPEQAARKPAAVAGSAGGPAGGSAERSVGGSPDGSAGAPAAAAATAAAPTPALQEAPVAIVREQTTSGSAAVPAPAPSAAEAAFGLPPKVDPVVADIDEVSSRIEAVRRLPAGHLVLRLANGQVWRENEPSRVRVESGVDASVRRGVIGNYWLTPESGRALRVRRVDCSVPDNRRLCQF